LQTAKQNGFEVNIIYVSLDTVETYFERVKNRVRNGGHDIGKDVIDRRFNSREKYLSKIIAIADKILIVNNTTSFQKIAYLEHGKIIYHASNITDNIEKCMTEFKLKNSA
jgi:predicted ABC-type ATPase